MGPGHGPMAGGDPSVMVDSHLGDLKTQLKITPAQEAAWQTFAAAAKQQAADMQAMRAQIGLLMPRLVGALAILVVGLVLANVLRRGVLLAAVNAGWPQARVAGGVVHFLTVAIVAAMVLDQLGLARPIVLTAFAIVVGAVMLALAIAVGVGSGPLLRRLLEERLAARARPESDGSSHL